MILQSVNLLTVTKTMKKMVWLVLGGLLNIRPKYQREFVYTENQQREVIYSIFKGYPLNVMYWVKNEDGSF